MNSKIELMDLAEYLTNEKLVDCAKVQKAYHKLVQQHKLTKQAICDTALPFKQKYNLTDIQALRIARREVSKRELFQIMKIKEN